MGLSHSPRIVTDGLILCVDAGDKMSYPGAGTAWTDLSKSKINGTLVNGPTFNSSNGGNIAFDGSNDYATLGTASSLFPGPSITASLFCWVKYISGHVIPIGGQYTVGQRLYIGVYYGVWDVGFGSYAWNANFSGTRVTATTNWTLISLIITAGSAVLYVNGQETITKTTDTSVSLGGPFSIGAFFYDGVLNGGYTDPCNIASTQVYNRALSAEEIKQNYNATKGRFGL